MLAVYARAAGVFGSNGGPGAARGDMNVTMGGG
jgi:hypothetical protein